MHAPILYSKRNKQTDLIFYGSIFLANQNIIYKTIGQSEDNLCFLRSLAKPLQAAILFDCNIIKDYKITNQELAMMAGSHSGTKKHTEI
ncbi:asparaginase, partial [bacterium]|nr:asparaginase [bacterium]